MPSPPPPSGQPSSGEAELRFGLDERRFPILTQIGKNLTLAAARGELDPVVGRDAEIEQALDVLAKRQGNNPCLVGAAGVGKTSVARGIAESIAARRDVASLDDRILIEIPIAELIAGTGVRGALAGRLAALKKEVRATGGRVVLFFDEIHQLFAGEAADEIAGDLKLALSRGELPCVGATTADEYRRFIDSDSALSRRFSVVEVDEPSREDAYLVLESVARKLERHHRVAYDDEALALTINWSMRYLPGRALPDKAVSIVDLAGARARRRGAERVTPEAVAEVVAGLAGMPIERLLQSDGDRMLRLEDILSERVIGHGEHMGKIARILRRNAAGLSGRRPIGTFLLLGPTGVGKTETAKAIAEVLFHTESAMTRIDMSELSEAHAVAKLIGAPPGYVGHDAGGQLTEAVRRRPYQVVLLDEIEKAHPEVLTAFLAVFDEGRMSDGRGRTVDFTNTVIVLTSNLGAGELSAAARKRVGFSRGGAAEAADLDSRVVAAARAALPPELYNRLDEVLAFSPLGRDDVRRIAQKMLALVSRSLEEQRDLRLEVEAAAVELLLDAGGFDPELGARPMRRTLARLVEAPLAEKILRGELGAGDVVLLGVEGGELSFDVLDADSSAAQ
jgi:ATP-dependent Clp protease ATP-binding subunit ClpC